MTEVTSGAETLAEKTSARMKAYWAQKRAQKAEAVEKPVQIAQEEKAEEAPAAAEPEPEPKPSKRGTNATQALEARYAGERATEAELREMFKTLELPKAFALYERMRKNLEIAGRILNDRSNVPEVQYCKTCGITMDSYQKRTRKNDWFLNRPHYRKGDRNIIDVEHFCSAACVSYENNKTQGVYGMSDQGMTPDMNPKNHPNRGEVKRG